MYFRGFVIGLLGVLVSQVVSADNWPQWRGAKLDSASNTEVGLPERLDKDTNMLWRVELPGPAGASPVVWDNRIFVTSAENEDLVLLCIGTDGKQQWKQKLEGRNQRNRDGGNSASPSPCTDGAHVWAMMTNGILYCFTVDGKQVWKKDLQEEYGDFKIQFGMTSTPVLDGGRLYCQLIHGSMRDRNTTSTGWVIAFDAKTGKEIWKHKRKTDATAENKHSYASPTIYRDAEREFLITHGGDFAIGHSLEDGSEIWRCGGINPKDSYNPFLRLVSSPVCVEGMIVVPTAKRGPVFSLTPDLKGDVTDSPKTRKWQADRVTPDVATPVVYDGHVYLARENGVLVCLDGKSGKTRYEERLFADRHRSTPLAADNKLYITGRDGIVTVVRAGDKMEVLSRNDLGEETTASPAISNGRVFVRTYKALYAFGKERN